MSRQAYAAVFFTITLGCVRGAADRKTDADPTGGQAAVVPADLPKLKPIGRFQLGGPHGRVYGHTIQFSDDGKRVAFGVGHDNTQVWDISKEPKQITDPKKPNGSSIFALSPSGKRLVVSKASRTEAFDVDTGKSIAKPGPDRFSHAFFLDENTVAWTQRSHGFDQHLKGRITVWNIEKNVDAGSFDVPDDRFRIAFPACNRSEFWLFLSNKKFEIECYDVKTGKLKRTIHPELSEPNRQYLDAGIFQCVTTDGSVFSATASVNLIYDGKSGKILAKKLPAGVSANENGLTPDGSRYLGRPNGDSVEKGGFAETDLILCDWRSGKCLAALTGFSAGKKSPIAAMTRDGRTVVAVAEEGEALVFDVSSVK